jgi:quercetin dioxygenase-like cupin family protein
MMEGKIFCKQLKGRQKFMRLLGGSRETKGLRSGYVVLGPGKAIGQHNTGPSQESILITSGLGVVAYGIKGKVRVKKGSFVYIPPGLTHNVINTGKGWLRYVYTAARI